MPRVIALFGTQGGGGVPEDLLTAKFIIGSEILVVRSPCVGPSLLVGHLEKSWVVCTTGTSTDHSDLGIHLLALYPPYQAARYLDWSVPIQIAAAGVYTNTHQDRSVRSHTAPTHTTIDSLYTHYIN